MRIDDLRDVLDDHADAMTPANPEPHTIVRARIRRRARVRTTGVVAAVLLVTGGAIGVPKLTLDANNPALPPVASTTATPMPSVNAALAAEPSSIDGDPLLYSYVLKPDESSGRFAVEVPPSGVRFALTCKDEPKPRRLHAQARVTVKGSKIGLGCGSSQRLSKPVSGRVVVDFTLMDESGNRPTGEYVIGVYTGTGATISKAGFDFPTVMGSPPHEAPFWKLTQATGTTAHDGMEFRLPATKGRVTVRYGMRDGATMAYSVDGKPQGSVSGGAGDGGSGLSTTYLEPGPARTLRLTSTDPAIVVAIYLER